MRKLLLLFLINFDTINGQSYVSIPDANFAAALHTIVPSAMNGNLLNTSSPLVASTQYINVKLLNISNLQGVQYFTSLYSLDCSYNYLTNLPPLANSLQFLHCEFNNLTSLPTIPNSLWALWCNGNSLNSLPVLNNSLAYLYCQNNSLTNLPNIPNTLLALDCSYNSLTNLPNLPNTLQSLYCYNNTLTDLPALPTALLSLRCFNNFLNSLPSFPNGLQQLLCENNNIPCFQTFPSSISPPTYNPSNHTTTFWIDLRGNPFNCLPNYISAMSSTLLAFPICTSQCTTTAGLDELNLNNNQVNIYPNPSNGQFIIETTTLEKQTIQLFDLNGKLVFNQNISNKTNIYASYLNEGIYNMVIKSGNNLINKKLVIVK